MRYLLLAVVLCGLLLTGCELSEETQQADLEYAYVTRVVVGDTIKVDIGAEQYTVRYIGMDTPETVHPSEPVEYMGKEASDYNKSLVEGRTVRLEYDIERYDRYGRLLAYVWLDETTMVNYVLVKEGYANVATYPPNVKYQDDFIAAERYAREHELGLWK